MITTIIIFGSLVLFIALLFFTEISTENYKLTIDIIQSYLIWVFVVLSCFVSLI